MNSNERSGTHRKRGGRPPKVAEDCLDDILVNEMSAAQRSQLMLQVRPSPIQVCPVRYDATLELRPGISVSAGRIYRRLQAMGVTPDDAAPAPVPHTASMPTPAPDDNENGQPAVPAAAKDSQGHQNEHVTGTNTPVDVPSGGSPRPARPGGPRLLGTVGIVGLFALVLLAGFIGFHPAPQLKSGLVETAFRAAQLGEPDLDVGSMVADWALIADVKNGADILRMLPALPPDVRADYVGVVIDKNLTRSLVIELATPSSAQLEQAWGERQDLIITSPSGLPSVVVITDRD